MRKTVGFEKFIPHRKTPPVNLPPSPFLSWTANFLTLSFYPIDTFDGPLSDDSSLELGKSPKDLEHQSIGGIVTINREIETVLNCHESDVVFVH